MDGNCSVAGDVKYYLAIDPRVIVAVKVLVGLSSSLSVVGASCIIITYFAFKDLRTTARALLVNLSIADILIAVSHFVGVLVNYERFMPYYNGTAKNDSSKDPVCVTQAAVTMLGSMSMFLWTMSIAVYILTLTVVGGKRRLLQVMVVAMYVICWGMPAFFVILSAVKRVLGAYTGGQVCYTKDSEGQDGNGTVPITTVFIVLSYEAWVYIAYIFLPLVYSMVFCYLRCNRKAKAAHSQMMTASKTDIKLLLIPVTFLLLRIWATVEDIFVFYMGPNNKYHCTKTKVAMQLLVAIGVNSQGTVNGILFCLLTKSVRQRWYHTVRRLCRRCRRSWQRQRGREDEHGLEDTFSMSTEHSKKRENYNTINSYTE